MPFLGMPFAEISFAEIPFAEISFAEMPFAEMLFPYMLFAEMPFTAMSFVKMPFAEMLFAENVVWWNVTASTLDVAQPQTFLVLSYSWERRNQDESYVGVVSFIFSSLGRERPFQKLIYLDFFVGR